eukprot:365361-Chlamydomonas_euryale.AAC.2
MAATIVRRSARRAAAIVPAAGTWRAAAPGPAAAVSSYCWRGHFLVLAQSVLYVGVVALRVVWRPHNLAGVDNEPRGASLLEALLDDAGRGAHDVLALLVLDEVVQLEGVDDVLGLDRGHLREVLSSEHRRGRG